LPEKRRDIRTAANDDRRIEGKGVRPKGLIKTGGPKEKREGCKDVGLEKDPRNARSTKGVLLRCGDRSAVSDLKGGENTSERTLPTEK